MEKSPQPASLESAIEHLEIARSILDELGLGIPAAYVQQAIDSVPDGPLPNTPPVDND